MSLPNRFHLPPLVRLLQQWVQADVAASQDVAQRLGAWLGAFDSVQLDAALQTISAHGRVVRGSDRAVDAAALMARLDHTRQTLTALAQTRLSQVRQPAWPNVASPADEPVDYGPYLQLYQTLQKQMDTQIGACRLALRQTLQTGSTRLRQIAAIDGVMAQLFNEREQRLLQAVPLYLERCFDRWRSRQTPHPDPTWLQGFEQDFQHTLQAELQTRLQPLIGLIEAVQQDSTHRT
jgi:hypothetical protein